MRLSLLTVLSLLLTLSGCAQQSPRLDHYFGHSLRLVQAQQTLYPEAGNNRAVVSGLDAGAASSVYDNYQRSFRTPDTQSNGFTIGLGSSNSNR